MESGRFLLLSAGGIVVLGRTAGLGDGEADRLAYALVAGIALAVLLLQVELRTGGVIARYRFAWFGIGRYDRGITVLLLIGRGGDASAAALARRRAADACGRVTVTEFDSRASILVLVAAFGAFAVAARLPRVVAVGMIGAVVLIAFVFPLVAPDRAAIERIRGQPAAIAAIGDPSPGQLALCRRADRRTAAARLGNGRRASALIVALLSFGAWQAWWLSTLWFGAALQARLGAGSAAGPKPLPAWLGGRQPQP